MRLIVDKITAERSGEIIFQNLQFSVGKGELVILSGPNGTGKSTLLRLIAGLIKPREGQIYCQFETSNQSERQTGNELFSAAFYCHYLSHENAMKPSMTLNENLNFWANFGGDGGQSVAEALSIVELDHLSDTPFAYLSTGQRRRAAIARLLINDRAIWLLDEPTSGLDQKSTDLFSLLMKNHLAKDGLIVAATHLPLGVEASASIIMTDYTPRWSNLRSDVEC